MILQNRPIFGCLLMWALPWMGKGSLQGGSGRSVFGKIPTPRKQKTDISESLNLALGFVCFLCWNWVHNKTRKVYRIWSHTTRLVDTVPLSWVFWVYKNYYANFLQRQEWSHCAQLVCNVTHHRHVQTIQFCTMVIALMSEVASVKLLQYKPREACSQLQTSSFQQISQPIVRRLLVIVQSILNQLPVCSRTRITVTPSYSALVLGTFSLRYRTSYVRSFWWTACWAIRANCHCPWGYAFHSLVPKTFLRTTSPALVLHAIPIIR